MTSTNYRDLSTPLSPQGERPVTAPVQKQDWHGKAIGKINAFESRYIERIPNLFEHVIKNYVSEQTKEKLGGIKKSATDFFQKEIEDRFAPLRKLKKFDAWLREDEFASLGKRKSGQQGLQELEDSLLKEDVGSYKPPKLPRIVGVESEDQDVGRSESRVENNEADEVENSGETTEMSRREKFEAALRALGIFLAKLPLRVARNILTMLFNIVKEALYTVAHPMKATMKLARMIVHLLKALTEPETWSKMGAGVIGGALGQLALGNPLAPIGFIIGAAMLCGGLLFGAVVAAINNSHEESPFREVGKQILKQLKQVPEAMLTGFLIGLMFGAIQKADYNKHLQEVEKNKMTYAKQTLPKTDGFNYKFTTVNVTGSPDGYTITASSEGSRWVATRREIFQQIKTTTTQVTIPHTPIVPNGGPGAVMASTAVKAVTDN